MTPTDDREIVEALATKVMGWKVQNRGTDSGCYLMGEQFPMLVTWDSGRNVLWMTGKESRAIEDWNPLTNAADSKALRDRLAELGHVGQTLRRIWNPTRWALDLCGVPKRTASNGTVGR